MKFIYNSVSIETVWEATFDKFLSPSSLLSLIEVPDRDEKIHNFLFLYDSFHLAHNEKYQLMPNATKNASKINIYDMIRADHTGALP